MEAWGFKYKTCGFVWVKRNKKSDSWFFGLGHYTRANAEICLIGTKGHPKVKSRSVSQICDARVAEHSKKPDEIRDRIVKIAGGGTPYRAVCAAGSAGLGLLWERSLKGGFANGN